MLESTHLRSYRDKRGGYWIRVPHTDIIACDFSDEVSHPDSRIAFNWTYLAEDDAMRFLKVARQKTDKEIEVQEQRMVSDSSIRKMAAYQKIFIAFIAAPGRMMRVNNELWRISRVSERGTGRIFMEKVAQQ